MTSPSTTQQPATSSVLTGYDDDDNGMRQVTKAVRNAALKEDASELDKDAGDMSDSDDINAIQHHHHYQQLPLTNPVPSYTFNTFTLPMRTAPPCAEGNGNGNGNGGHQQPQQQLSFTTANQAAAPNNFFATNNTTQQNNAIANNNINTYDSGHEADFYAPESNGNNDHESINGGGVAVVSVSPQQSHLSEEQTAEAFLAARSAAEVQTLMANLPRNPGTGAIAQSYRQALAARGVHASLYGGRVAYVGLGKKLKAALVPDVVWSKQEAEAVEKGEQRRKEKKEKRKMKEEKRRIKEDEHRMKETARRSREDNQQMEGVQEMMSIKMSKRVAKTRRKHKMEFRQLQEEQLQYNEQQHKPQWQGQHQEQKACEGWDDDEAAQMMGVEVVGQDNIIPWTGSRRSRGAKQRWEERKASRAAEAAAKEEARKKACKYPIRGH